MVERKRAVLSALLGVSLAVSTLGLRAPKSFAQVRAPELPDQNPPTLQIPPPPPRERRVLYQADFSNVNLSVPEENRECLNLYYDPTDRSMHMAVVCDDKDYGATIEPMLDNFEMYVDLRRAGGEVGAYYGIRLNEMSGDFMRQHTFAMNSEGNVVYTYSTSMLGFVPMYGPGMIGTERTYTHGIIRPEDFNLVSIIKNEDGFKGSINGYDFMENNLTMPGSRIRGYFLAAVPRRSESTGAVDVAVRGLTILEP
jgi:hypothetical protein